MKAKINEKILCIPPYVSVSWDQVSFLHSHKDEERNSYTLAIHLKQGAVIQITDLEPALIEIAFTAHLQHLEKSESVNKIGAGPFGMEMSSFPIRLGNNGALGTENFEMALQHNPNQAAMPPLPPELLEKFAAIAQILTNGEMGLFPKPEAQCNCMHCQLSRAIHKLPFEEAKEEEAITEEDLQFRDWEIVEKGDELYTVTNPLDKKEQYNVFLGSPIGCTCGRNQCEHIKAVLLS